MRACCGCCGGFQWFRDMTDRSHIHDSGALLWRSCNGIISCPATMGAVVVGGLARVGRPVASPPTASTLSALWQALQQFQFLTEAQITGAPHNLCSGALAARSAPALVLFAHPFLRGLPEWVDPLPLPRPLARSRPCGRRCNGFQFFTERKSTGVPYRSVAARLQRDQHLRWYRVPRRSCGACRSGSTRCLCADHKRALVPVAGAATIFSFVQSANQRTSVRAYTTRSHSLYKCTEFTVAVSTELAVHLL